MWVKSWFNLVAKPVRLLGWALLSMNEIALNIIWLKRGFVQQKSATRLVMVGVEGKLICWFYASSCQALDSQTNTDKSHALSETFHTNKTVVSSFHYFVVSRVTEKPSPGRGWQVSNYSYVSREISIHSRQAQRWARNNFLLAWGQLCTVLKSYPILANLVDMNG